MKTQAYLWVVDILHVFFADICNDHLVPSDRIGDSLALLSFRLSLILMGNNLLTLLSSRGLVLRVDVFISVLLVPIKAGDEFLDVGDFVLPAPWLAGLLLLSRHLGQPIGARGLA